MSADRGPTASAVWRASADTIVATLAAGLILVVFYPLTMCAAGVKRFAGIKRPQLSKSRSAYYQH